MPAVALGSLRVMCSKARLGRMIHLSIGACTPDVTLAQISCQIRDSTRGWLFRYHQGTFSGMRRGRRACDVAISAANRLIQMNHPLIRPDQSLIRPSWNLIRQEQRLIRAD